VILHCTVIAMVLAPTVVKALELNARLPTKYGESVVVRNDGGVRNVTTHFPYGAFCHTDLDLKTWLVIKRIVGDRALMEVDLDFDISVYGLSCPHRTETSMPVAQAQKRHDDFVRATEHQFILDFAGPAPTANALSLDMPTQLKQLADEVIE
jgi:hypothetical protein